MHPQADIIIQEDGILPKCNLCGMRTPNVQKHQNSYTCKQAQRRRTNEQRQDDQFRAEKVTFNIKGKEIEKVHYFKYLGNMLFILGNFKQNTHLFLLVFYTNLLRNMHQA